MGRINKEQQYLLKLNQRRSTHLKEAQQSVIEQQSIQQEIKEEQQQQNNQLSEEEEGQQLSRPQQNDIRNNPSKQDFERVIRTVGSKDEMDIFKEPVTEKIAPGYFDVVKQPMDLNSMRQKARNGDYIGWESLLADFDLMFANAMLYNGDESVIYKAAVRLKNVSHKLVEISKQGITDFRGHITVVIREENRREMEEEQGIVREEKPKKEQVPPQPRKSQKRHTQVEQNKRQDLVDIKEVHRSQIGQMTRVGRPTNEQSRRSRGAIRQAQRDFSKIQGQIDEHARKSYLQKSQKFKEYAGSLAGGLTPYGLEIQMQNPTIQLRKNIRIQEYIQSRLSFAEGINGVAKDYILTQLADAIQDVIKFDPQLEGNVKVSDDWQFNFAGMQGQDFSQADYQMLDLEDTKDGLLIGKNNFQISVLREIYDEPLKIMEPDGIDIEVPLVATMLDHYHNLSEDKHSIQQHYNATQQSYDNMDIQYV